MYDAYMHQSIPKVLNDQTKIRSLKDQNVRKCRSVNICTVRCNMEQMMTKISQ